jgi:2',3'-cyclic-nucleotide 2'-phosphodiesterase (5'-nucleotidase family)
MVKLKNYNLVLKHFGLLLTFLFVVSCGQHSYNVTKIEGKKIGITDKVGEVSEIDTFIKPFRENIDKDLNQVLAYCPETLDKSKGEWQTNIGCFLADITLEKSNIINEKRENQKVDICFLNHGGIRTIIPKGNVSARNAYEVIPFENSAVVVSLKGEQILEIINYIIAEKKPHPLAGMTFTIDRNGIAKNIMIQGKAFDNDKSYNVATSDYLSNGGDNMNFFKKCTKRVDTDYKLRNLMIDYFKEVDTLKINHDIRITKEQ